MHAAANPRLRHFYVSLAAADKVQALRDLAEGFGRMLVYVGRTATAVALAGQLDDALAAVAHADLPDKGRASLRRFRAGEVPVLIATGVAARGVDVEDVRVVMQYELVQDGGQVVASEYIQRAGRAGRAGARGVCVSLISEPAEIEAFRDPGWLADKVGRALEVLPGDLPSVWT